MIDEQHDHHVRRYDLLRPSSIVGKLRDAAYQLEHVAELLSEAADDIEGHDLSFNLRWDADMRAIKRWQAEKPGRDMTWPDHADLVVWLLGQHEKLVGELNIAIAARDGQGG